MASRFGWLAIALALTACTTPVPNVALSPQSSAAPPAEPSVMPVAQPPVYEPTRIAVEDAYKRVKAENLLILDVRGEASYAAEHIEGAINIPWANLKETYSQLPKDRFILLYCT
jgi:3-mercaptopyruvate sulfurtransferase SseA